MLPAGNRTPSPASTGCTALTHCRRRGGCSWTVSSARRSVGRGATNPVMRWTSTPTSRPPGSTMDEPRRGPRRSRPIVVIPARFSEGATVLRHRAEVNAAKLVESVWAAGGEPLTVHPDAPGAALVDAVAKRFGMADAILLPGGGDMSARWSGQQAHESLYGVDEEQDAFDLALGRWALRDGIPLLAICRGNQVVNVARGGHLVQDMTRPP